VHPYILVPHLLFSPYLHSCAWKKGRGTEKGESKKKKEEEEIGRNTKILKVLPFLPPWVIAEQDKTPSIATPSHLQKLVKLGFMSVMELYAYQVLKDPAFPTHAKGYVVSFAAFYERGFCVPPHGFLLSLLWYYGLELHHLSPSGVLHIAAFVTLCEAYLGINPDLDLWKYFFRVQHLMIFGGTVIHVKWGME
jgi:hypothetical protein